MDMRSQPNRLIKPVHCRSNPLGCTMSYSMAERACPCWFHAFLLDNTVQDFEASSMTYGGPQCLPMEFMGLMTL